MRHIDHQYRLGVCKGRMEARNEGGTSMRYGNASMICMLTVGVVYGVSGGCGNSGNSSVFQGSGGLTSGTGTNTGTATGGLTSGSTGSGILTTGTGGTQTGGSGTGGPNSDAACANQVSDSNA